MSLRCNCESAVVLSFHFHPAGLHFWMLPNQVGKLTQALAVPKVLGGRSYAPSMSEGLRLPRKIRVATF